MLEANSRQDTVCACIFFFFPILMINMSCTIWKSIQGNLQFWVTDFSNPSAFTKKDSRKFDLELDNRNFGQLMYFWDRTSGAHVEESRTQAPWRYFAIHFSNHINFGHWNYANTNHGTHDFDWSNKKKSAIFPHFRFDFGGDRWIGSGTSTPLFQLSNSRPAPAGLQCQKIRPTNWFIWKARADSNTRLFCPLERSKNKEYHRVPIDQ